MKWLVKLKREALQTLTVEVEADSKEEAEALAVETPEDYPISGEEIEGFHDFEVESTEEAPE